MIVLPLAPVLPKTALLSSPDAFFEVVKQDYREYRARGMFVEHGREALLVYRLRENGRTFTGLICAVASEAYDTGVVRHHEGTLAASEQQQLQLLLLREAQVKPVLLTYPVAADVEQVLAKAVADCPLLIAVDDDPQIRHEVYEVLPDTAIYKEVQAAFAKTVDRVYIADGHHRCSTVALYNREQRAHGKPTIPLLAALFSSSQVDISPYHRVAQLPVDLSPLALMARLSQVCTIERLSAPRAPLAAGELTMLLRDESFVLHWRQDCLNAGTSPLDAGCFNEVIARDIFGVTDIRTDQRITYVPGTLGTRGMIDLVQHRPDRVGFMLHGLAPAQLFEVVDGGGILPPKSTWFEPRMRNGLVVLEF